MKKEQKIVAVGAASGVVTMILALYVLTAYVIPVPLIADTVTDRLAYALSGNLFAMLPLVVMLIAVGNARFFSRAIDPTLHAEDRKIEINGRVADNTLQQNFVFLIASLAVATLIPMQYLQFLWAAAIVFIVARIVFWIGYRIGPLYRAPGMAATSYMNMGMILYSLYRIFF